MTSRIRNTEGGPDPHSKIMGRGGGGERKRKIPNALYYTSLSIVMRRILSGVIIRECAAGAAECCLELSPTYTRIQGRM